MGLVDYDSDSSSSSDSGSAPAPASAPATAPGPASGSKVASKPPQASSKKPFRKVVDRSNPGKILVSLPTLANDDAHGNNAEPPAKRARTNGAGGLFSGFNSFLPAPKNTGRHAIKPSASSSATRPGVHLKTSAAPGFSRDGGADEDETPSSMLGPAGSPSTGLSLPPPKRQEAVPSIPEGQKPADEVKLVGKPLMFRPLSVGLDAKKKKKKNNNNKNGPNSTVAPQGAPSLTQSPSQLSTDSAPADASAPVPQKKKVSLFSMHTEEPAAASPSPADDYPDDDDNDAYKPFFETAYGAEAPSTEYWEPAGSGQRGAPANEAPATDTPTSLDHMADDLNLSAAARRELFGRDGSNFAAKAVVNFNMDREYQHNEHVRASGDQQMHQPVRALQGGKHSLKQLVQSVQNQKEALEDSFAKGRSNRREASSRYGW
ncbi:hypothetical protein E4U42_000476 [Claviceps africana]|uniref:Stress activated map kinase interacting n=1 Tax=Claviceps africana TaxID=83212 RepID=A0A8K0NFJ0_9HYPO|nr:hypothetical protein E4U42_000476 [Claviceps africana]